MTDIESSTAEQPSEGVLPKQLPQKYYEVKDEGKNKIKEELLEDVVNGDISSFKKIMNKYADMKLEEYKASNDHGDSLLHLAAFHGHLEIVKFIVNNKILPKECRNEYKNTPLHRAARQGQLEVVKYLIEKENCDRMCVCHWGRTPLHMACRRDQLEVVKYLMSIERVDFKVKDKKYRSTPLDLAAQCGSVETVRFMIEERNCYNPDDYPDGSYNPLHFAAYRGNIKVVEYLVGSRGFDVNAKGLRNRTPLHSACQNDRLEVVKYLMETERIEVSPRDQEHGLTPIDLAAEHGSLELVQYMVNEMKCPMQEPNQNKYTPLHCAARGGKVNNVIFFIKSSCYGSDCKGSKGRTPLHSACRGGKNDVVECLVRDYNIDPSCKDDDGNTPLHAAVKSGDKSVVALLIQFGCDINVANNEGKGPVTVAKECGHDEIIKYLEQDSEVEENIIYKKSLGQAKRLLEEAMKDGYVTVKLVKVLVVGSAGVGKTSLIKLLLDQDPPEERNSTGCLERSIRVIRILREKRGKVEEEEWNEKAQQELNNMIAEALPVLLKDLKKGDTDKQDTKQATSPSNTENPNKEEESKRDKTNESQDREESDRNEESQDTATPHATHATSETATNDTDIKKSIEDVMKDFTRLISSAKSSEHRLTMELIYLTDTGGQQAYWDLAPIFTRDTTATLFVHRLCDKLDDTPLNDVYERGERVGPSQKARITTAQAFKTMLQNSARGKSRSKIIVVGTHKDLAGSCEENLEQKNKKLEKIASPQFSKDIVYINDALNGIIFEVNTKNPSKDDKEKAAKIKASIHKVTKPDVKIPIWWFILQQVLEGIAKKRGTDILSKEDCNIVSNDLGFPEAQLNAALDFFDKLNIFLYKPNILPGVVFTNAQVPLDKLSELVHRRHQLQAVVVDPTTAATEPCPGEWKEFRDHGTLYTDLLRKFSRHYVNEVFTEDGFLQLLEKLLIVSKYPKSSADECYFFPAILDVKKDIEIPNSPEIAPLVVMFPNGWAPPGVFCCTVCYLMSQAGWKIRQPTQSDSTDMTKEKAEYVARNSITFARKSEPGSVTIVDRLEFFAVYVNIDTKKVQGKSLIRHCEAIKSEVFAAVKTGLEKTHHNRQSQPEPAFYCPTHKSHIATVSSEDKHWVCSVNCNEFDHLTPEQTVWFGGQAQNGRTGLLDRDRHLGDAKRILVNYLNKDQLRDIFRELGLANATLEEHYQDYGLNEYAGDLLKAWINKRDGVLEKGGPTWENLKTALTKKGHNGAVEEINKL